MADPLLELCDLVEADEVCARMAAIEDGLVPDSDVEPPPSNATRLARAMRVLLTDLLSSADALPSDLIAVGQLLAAARKAAEEDS